MGNTPENSPYIKDLHNQLTSGKLVVDDETLSVLVEDRISRSSFAYFRELPIKDQQLFYAICFRHKMRIMGAYELAEDYQGRSDYGTLLTEQILIADLIVKSGKEKLSDDESQQIVDSVVGQFEDFIPSADEEEIEHTLNGIIDEIDEENPGLLEKAEEILEREQEFAIKVISS